MDIDMKELEAFASVVEKGGFSKAAEALFLTQPTISAHVASLEQKLGVKLLVRSGREVYPSDAGTLLYGYAREILRLRTSAVEAVEAFTKEMRGSICVAASTIPGQYYLPRLIQSFRSRWPDVTFNLRILDSREVAGQVEGREVELGFTGAAIPLPKCSYEPLCEDQLVLATPNTPRYRSYSAAGYPIRQLSKETFIRREPGSGTRIETEAFFRELGIDSRRLSAAVEVRSTETIREMVAEGLGVAILSKSACGDFAQFGKLLTFDLGSPALRRRLYLVTRKGAILSPVAQTFHDFALEFFRQEEQSEEKSE